MTKLKLFVCMYAYIHICVFLPENGSSQSQMKLFAVIFLQFLWKQICGWHCPIISEQFMPIKIKEN